CPCTGGGRVERDGSWFGRGEVASHLRGTRTALDRHNRQVAWGVLFLKSARRHRSELAPPKAMPDWEEFMPRLVGFSRFAALLEEQIGKKITPATKGWSYGGASGPASTLSRTVMQMSRLFGCSRARWSSASAANSESATRATSSSFREVSSTRHGSTKTPS